MRGRKPIKGLSAITLRFSSPRTERTPGICNKPPGIPPLTLSLRDARVWGWGGEGSAFVGTEGHLQGPSRPLRDRQGRHSPGLDMRICFIFTTGRDHVNHDDIFYFWNLLT